MKLSVEERWFQDVERHLIRKLKGTFRRTVRGPRKLDSDDAIELAGFLTSDAANRMLRRLWKEDWDPQAAADHVVFYRREGRFYE